MTSAPRSFSANQLFSHSSPVLKHCLGMLWPGTFPCWTSSHWSRSLCRAFLPFSRSTLPPNFWPSAKQLREHSNPLMKIIDIKVINRIYPSTEPLEIPHVTSHKPRAYWVVWIQGTQYIKLSVINSNKTKALFFFLGAMCLQWNDTNSCQFILAWNLPLMCDRVMDYFKLFGITRFIHYGPYIIKELATKGVAVHVFYTAPHCTSLRSEHLNWRNTLTSLCREYGSLFPATDDWLRKSSEKVLFAAPIKNSQSYVFQSRFISRHKQWGSRFLRSCLRFFYVLVNNLRLELFYWADFASNTNKV